jgi:hypothetical protein
MTPTQRLGADPEHVAALARITTQVGKIRYACEVSKSRPSTAAVRDWLVRHGVPEIRRAYVSTHLNAWRRERGMADTGELPALSVEMLSELDPAAATLPAVAPRSKDSAGPAGVFYAAAVLGMGVSVNTSWRFFGAVLGITERPERVVLFAVLELAMVACGIGMRAGVRSAAGRPGPSRMIAWALTGLSAYMALLLSGPLAGAARVVLGPLLSLVMLHLALGIELRATGHRRTGTWSRVLHEIRERLLSRFGLADDDRDALTRTRDRAARRVAHLALASRWTPFRRTRLARALRASDAAHDPQYRTRMLAELAAARHVHALADLDQPSPWTS